MSDTATQAGPPPAGEPGKFITLEIDGAEYRWPEETITGAEIMELAGIAPEEGLVRLHDDGTQESVAPEEVIELKPGRRFKHRPRFKRGDR